MNECITLEDQANYNYFHNSKPISKTTNGNCIQLMSSETSSFVRLNDLHSFEGDGPPSQKGKDKGTDNWVENKLFMGQSSLPNLSLQILQMYLWNDAGTR